MERIISVGAVLCGLYACGAMSGADLLTDAWAGMLAGVAAGYRLGRLLFAQAWQIALLCAVIGGAWMWAAARFPRVGSVTLWGGLAVLWAGLLARCLPVALPWYGAALPGTVAGWLLARRPVIGITAAGATLFVLGIFQALSELHGYSLLFAARPPGESTARFLLACIGLMMLLAAAVQRARRIL